MELEFKQVGDPRIRFLQKQRSNKNELERQEQRNRNIIRVQATIRRALYRVRTFKEVWEQAASNMPLVLKKQQELPREKAAKVMSNVIYRMPYFFQSVLSVNANNYRMHW